MLTGVYGYRPSFGHNACEGDAYAPPDIHKV